MRSHARRGFTLVELLVVVLIVGLLLGLLLPNTTVNRALVRRSVCMNNLAMLAKAMLISEANTREFPGYMRAQRIDAGAPWKDEFLGTTDKEIAVAWPTTLLPMVDQERLYGALLAGQSRLIDVDHPPAIEAFVCPSDPPVDANYGAISYVVNSGMPDVARPSAQIPSDLQANGICHDLLPDRFGPRVAPGNIRDGATSTLLLAENWQRDYPETPGAVGNTWLRPQPGAQNVEQWYGMTWAYDPQDPLDPPASLWERVNRDTRSNPGGSYRNEGSRFARPAANHPGSVAVAFCDGHVISINADIDFRCINSS